jgi:hypothetical protein
MKIQLAKAPASDTKNTILYSSFVLLRPQLSISTILAAYVLRRLDKPSSIEYYSPQAHIALPLGRRNKCLGVGRTRFLARTTSMSLRELRLHVGEQSVQLPTFYGCSNHIGEIDVRNAIDRHSVDLHDDRAHEYMLIDIANSGHTSIPGWVAATDLL